MDEYKKRIGVTIGNNIKATRKSAGISLKELAAKIDISTPQIDKYEKGTDNIPVYRLQHIAKILSKDISYFLKNNNEEILASALEGNDIMCVRLMNNFRRIKNKRCQEAIIHIAKELAEKDKE